MATLALGPATADTTIVDRVAAALIAHVRSHRLQAGEALPSEVKASAYLGVSRGVVREAYRSLAAAGIADIANGRSPRVGHVTNRSLIQLMQHAVSTDQASARQILELRSPIEERAVQLAVAHHTAADIMALRRAVAGMRAALNTRPHRYLEADIRFHEIIGRATGNALFALLATALREAVVASMRVSLKGRSRAELNRVIRTHSEIVDAIEAERPGDARRLMVKHFTEALASVDRPAPRPRQVRGRTAAAGARGSRKR
jgi:DNA-binding FadR family transcriptional regulator